ncbi:MAG: DNA polymerase III subunit delta [Pyrinomonadaceae bacterium]
MKVFSRADLRNQLRRNKIEPVYLFFGNEVYLRTLAVNTVTDMALRGSQLRAFNESEISLVNSGISSVIATADQIPMIDAKRVIKVTEVAVSATKSKDTIQEEDEEILRRYLENPSKETVLIFIADEIDKRRKISKLLLSKSYSVEFTQLNDVEMLSWAKDRLKDSNVTADENALRHLVMLIGNDVRKLSIELEKLATAALPGTKISDELITALAPNLREIPNFDLADQLLSRNRSAALQIMKKVLDDGAEPLMLLGLLSYNFRRLFWARELMDEGAEESQISNIVKLPWNAKREFLRTARQTDKAKFTRILKRIAETDLAIKTSVSTPRLQLEMLVIELSGI